MPLLGPENGESPGNGGGGFYSFLGLIKNGRGAYSRGPTWSNAMASIVLVTVSVSLSFHFHFHYSMLVLHIE